MEAQHEAGGVRSAGGPSLGRGGWLRGPEMSAPSEGGAAGARAEQEGPREAPVGRGRGQGPGRRGPGSRGLASSRARPEPPRCELVRVELAGAVDVREASTVAWLGSRVRGGPGLGPGRCPRGNTHLWRRRGSLPGGGVRVRVRVAEGGRGAPPCQNKQRVHGQAGRRGSSPRRPCRSPGEGGGGMRAAPHDARPPPRNTRGQAQGPPPAGVAARGQCWRPERKPPLTAWRSLRQPRGVSSRGQGESDGGHMQAGQRQGHPGG